MCRDKPNNIDVYAVPLILFTEYSGLAHEYLLSLPAGWLPFTCSTVYLACDVTPLRVRFLAEQARPGFRMKRLWEEHTRDGKTFYYNPQSKQSVWIKPPDFDKMIGTCARTRKHRIFTVKNFKEQKCSPLSSLVIYPTHVASHR